MRYRAVSFLIAASLSTAAFAQHADKWEPRTKVVEDWVYGCQGDEPEIWSCEAIALAPENGAKIDFIPVLIRRDRMSKGYLSIPVSYDDLLSIYVDERRILNNVERDKYDVNPQIVLNDKQFRKLLLALLSGKIMTVKAANGDVITTVSLAGATAALTQLDKLQELAGYKNAFVLRGNKKIKDVLRRMSMTSSPPSKFSAVPDKTAIDAILATTKCDNGQPVGANSSIHAISPKDRYDKKNDRAILLADCGTDGTNAVKKMYVATRSNTDGAWSFQPGEYYDYTAQKFKPTSLMYNAKVEEDIWRGYQLHSVRYAGTNKDCGEAVTIDLEGSYDRKPAPRIDGIKEMPVCRGVTKENWINTKENWIYIL
jgi:hypothetical protein